MDGWRGASSPKGYRSPSLSAGGVKRGDVLLAVVKKYRVQKHQESRLVDLVHELSKESSAKAERKRQLEQTCARMVARKEDFSKRQHRVRQQEHEKAVWFEEEYKKVKIENSCMSIERKKLSIQIDHMRQEIAKMITEDEEKRLYFEAGVPLTSKHETNFSQMYNFSKEESHTAISHSRKPPGTIFRQKAARMGNFTSSPDVRINDTYKQDHRRFEKMKDYQPKAAHFVNESAFTRSEDDRKTCNLLSKISLKPPKFKVSKPVLKNILTEVHKNTLPYTPQREIMSGSYLGGRTMFKSHDVDGPKSGNKFDDDSVNLNRSRHTLIHQSRPVSRISVVSKNKNISAELPREKANQVLVRMDNIAKVKFGQGYIDWIAILADLNAKILKVEKKIKKRNIFHRHTLLVILNLVLCFKKAFYILKFHDSMQARTGMSSHRSLYSAMPPLSAELAEIYSKLTELGVKISDYSKTLINPDLEPKLEPLKLIKFKRDNSRSSIGMASDWTKKLEERKSIKKTPESIDAPNLYKTTEVRANQSVLSAPQSTTHLKALEPANRKRKIYDVSWHDADIVVPPRGRGAAAQLQHEQLT